jgi:hypothetical protein
MIPTLHGNVLERVGTSVAPVFEAYVGGAIALARP